MTTFNSPGIVTLTGSIRGPDGLEARSIWASLWTVQSHEDLGVEEFIVRDRPRRSFMLAAARPGDGAILALIPIETVLAFVTCDAPPDNAGVYNLEASAAGRVA